MAKDDKFKCDECGEAFDTKKGLQTHVGKVHGDLDDSDIENVLKVLEEGVDQALDIKKEKQKLENRIEKMISEEEKLEHEVEDLEESKDKMKKNLKEIKNEKEKLERETEQLKDDRARLNAKKESLENDIESLKEEKEGIESELSSKKDVVRRLKHKIFEFDKKIKE